MQVLNRATMNAYVVTEEPLLYLRKTAGFYLNAAALELVGLKEGDIIEFYRDGGFVYMSKTINNQGFKLRRIGKNNGLSFSSVQLRDFFRKHWGKSQDATMHFELKETSLTPSPFVKWSLNLKVYKNG